MKQPLLSLPPGRNVPISQAAAIMGKSPQFIRVCLQQGILPFGSAVKVSPKRWNYYISPKLFSDFVGLKYIEANEESTTE